MRIGKHLFLTLAAAAILLIHPRGAAGTIAPGPAPLAQGEERQVASTPEELRFVALANRERARRGLGALTIDPVLIAVAREHSREMMERNYFDHVSPGEGTRTPMARYLKGLGHRPDYACVGENLFYCSLVDIERGHRAFMNSPSHRENLLFPRFEWIGVGIQKNHRGEFWVTQMFLATRSK